MGCNCKKGKKSAKQSRGNLNEIRKKQKDVVKLTEKDLTNLISKVISEKNNQ